MWQAALRSIAVTNADLSIGRRSPRIAKVNYVEIIPYLAPVAVASEK